MGAAVHENSDPPKSTYLFRTLPRANLDARCVHSPSSVDARAPAYKGVRN